MSNAQQRTDALILDCNIDALTWDEAVDRLTVWAAKRESRYVCICNVHSVVTARRRMEFRQVVNQADMATCDGMPLAWYLRRNGYPRQQRINGPDLMWKCCERAQADGIPIFLYGATDETLLKLTRRLRQVFPRLRLAGVYSPPFRELTADEEEGVISLINDSGAGFVFISLGCPKQELWMARQRGKLPGVMVGVGAAFDYHAGVVKRAPGWMQNRGLEWLYRLMSEPRRLWRRYLTTNSLFVYYLLRQWMRAGKPGQGGY